MSRKDQNQKDAFHQKNPGVAPLIILGPPAIFFFYVNIPALGAVILIIAIVSGAKIQQTANEMDESETYDFTTVTGPKEEGQLPSYIAPNAGPTVTIERIDNIVEFLRDDEEVYHILRVVTLSHGNDNSNNNKSRSQIGTWGTAAFTQDRIIIKMPSLLGDDQFSIHYSNILSVAYNLEGMLGKREFTITTAHEKYRMAVHLNIDDEEVREIVEWTDMKAAEEQSESTPPSDEKSASKRLNELESLRERGHVTDEEFEKKRTEIVEDI